MLGFTRKTDYALVALATLAAEGSRRDGWARLSARQIAERHGVPLALLMNVLKDLVGCKLVTSTRGAKGGYRLARDPAAITVHEIVAATEGPVKVMACCGEPEETPPCVECGVVVTCPVTRSVRRLNERINEFLEEVTLADLIREDPDAIRPVSREEIRLEFRPLKREAHG